MCNLRSSKKERKINKMRGWAAKQLHVISDEVRSPVSNCSSTGLAAIKIPVLDPSTFQLEEILDATQWTLVQRRRKKKEASGVAAPSRFCSGRRSTTSPFKRSPARGFGKKIQTLVNDARPHFPDRDHLVYVSNLNRPRLSTRNKVESDVVKGRTQVLGHKGPVLNFVGVRTKGTRPRSFNSAGVLGLRKRNPNTTYEFPARLAVLPSSSMAGRGTGRAGGFNQFHGGQHNRFADAREDRDAPSSIGGQSGWNQGRQGAAGLGIQGHQNQNFRSSGPGSFERGEGSGA